MITESPQAYRHNRQAERLERIRELADKALGKFPAEPPGGEEVKARSHCQAELDYLNACIATQADLEEALGELMVAVTAGQGIVQAAYEEHYECENPPP